MSTQSLNAGVPLEDLTKKTIDILSRFIQKPPLNTKLLSKPPFRYLHDMISEIIKVSGICEGLYDENEMNSENYKDKDSKVMFLTKMIDCMKFATGVELKVNPLKIVAGLEPEETNVFLQLIGKVVLKKVDTKKAVIAVNAGKKLSIGQEAIVQPESIKPPPKVIPTTAPSTSSQSNEPALKLDEENVKTSNAVGKPVASPSPNPGQKSSPASAPIEKPAESQKRVEETAPSPVLQTKKLAENNEVKNPTAKPPTNSFREPLSSDTEKEVDPQLDENGMDAENDSGRFQPIQMKRRERPMSARPPPPKLKPADVVEEETRNLVPIHTDGLKKDEDDDEFIIQAVQREPKPESGLTDQSNDQHGGLVQKILQTKQELEGKDGSEAKSNATLSVTQVGSKEISFLRESIQQLCQSTNPLGKTMDYLQEDVDAMNKELEIWKRETGNFKRQADEQQDITKKTLSPYEEKLAQIEVSIEEQLQKIASLKSDILQNDITTEKLLRTIVSSK
ncbi:microtubule-binding protein MIP-T3-domain-containing protein [Globomyces pollinis-pini]|nr:microtubule-binding protein MIP-T3-domain-containing protein [Globomyces pollinis-pini]